MKVLKNDYKYQLSQLNMYKKHFQSNINVRLNANTGMVTIPAGTMLNYDSDNDGEKDALFVQFGYKYFVKTDV